MIKNKDKTSKEQSSHGIGHQMPSMRSNNRALKITSWLTGIYFIIELGLGIYSRSVSVMSDAFHTFSAVGGILLALIASRIAIRPADKFKSFGWWRAEIIGALLNGFFLLAMAIFVLYMGWMRLQRPIELPTTPMFIAAGGGIIIEIIALKLLYSGQKSNLNIKGAFWHIIQTFVGSIIIIIAAIVIKFTGFYQIDPILGMIFGLVLLWVSWLIIKNAFNILLETAPPNINLEKIKKDLESIPGVENVHHIHAWVLTSGKNVFSSHIKITKRTDSEDILVKAQDLLKDKYRFFFSTIQVEEKIHKSESENIDITKKQE